MTISKEDRRILQHLHSDFYCDGGWTIRCGDCCCQTRSPCGHAPHFTIDYFDELRGDEAHFVVKALDAFPQLLTALDEADKEIAALKERLGEK